MADRAMQALNGAEYGCASEFCKGGNMAARWREVRNEIMVRIGEWWLQYPKATLQEIEAAVNARLPESRARARFEKARVGDRLQTGGIA